MIRRADLVARLRASTFDLLVVGGGIVGAGIARDAAMRGLKVALIEQGDFGSGTSSKTSKLIHGGLRYLEQGQARLVFESLRERQTLRTIAPTYVRPLSLLLPIYAGDRRPAWKINAGLWLYDLLASGRTIRSHRMLSARRALAVEPGLLVEGLQAAGVYADCQMDDARVCLANILQAIHFGAVCGNYVRLRTLLQGGHRICGGVAEDALTGVPFEIQATVVVNATGPWADRTRRMSDASAAPQLSPTKGIHLIVPRLTQEALFVQGRADGRMLFLLPWGDYSLIGTTEAAVGDDALESLSAEADEVGYLLEEANRIVPGAHLDGDDVIATFAGARPLLASGGTNATQASREHRIDVDPRGLVSVMGGKFTTYRLMAQQAVDRIVKEARWPAERCLTDQVSLLEAIQPVSIDHWKELTRAVEPDLLARFLSRYGAATLSLLRIILREPVLAQPLCPHHEVCAAELVHAIQAELACTITDALARRTRIAWSSCQGLDALSTVAELFQRYGGIARPQVEPQVEQYRAFLAHGLAFRNGHAVAA